MNRRDFLVRAASAGAAAAAMPCLVGPGRAQAAEKPRWAMRLSTSTVEFSTLPVEKAVEQIAALGFEGIDFWPANFQCPHLDEIQQRLGPEGLKELLAKNHLKLYAFTCYGAEYPKGSKVHSDGYPARAELLGKAGGGVAVRESPPVKPKNVQAEIKAFLERLKPEIELAEKYNSYVAVENHVGNLLNSVDSFKAFVEMNPSRRLGIALAPYHLQAEKTSVEEVIGIIGKQLFFFYAWQNFPDLQQLPGVGPTDFTPWLAALAKADYAWYVNPFMHHHPGPEKMAQSLAVSRKFLLDCYRKAVPV